MTLRRTLTEQEYRLLVERSPSMIRHTNTGGESDYFNDTWLAFTGRDVADETGDGWTKGMHQADYARFMDLFRSNFEERRAFDIEYRLRRHDGAFRYIHDREVPLYDDGGWFVGFTGTCVDRDELARGELARSSFLKRMAQELRRPLSAIHGQVALLSRAVQSRAALSDELVGRVERQVERLTSLVEQLASAARLENGAPLVLEVSDFDLTELVSDLVLSKTDALRARGVSSVPGVGIESPRTRRPMEGDGPKLAVALGNVMDNAIQFSRGGRVSISMSSSSRYHAVTVSDDGIGIPEDDLGSVTRPYIRGSNVSQKNYPGVGLGLAIATEIVQAHAGRLQVDSKAEGGTRVTVILPRAAMRS